MQSRRVLKFQKLAWIDRSTPLYRVFFVYLYYHGLSFSGPNGLKSKAGGLLWQASMQCPKMWNGMFERNRKMSNLQDVAIKLRKFELASVTWHCIKTFQMKKMHFQLIINDFFPCDWYTLYSLWSKQYVILLKDSYYSFSKGFVTHMLLRVSHKKVTAEIIVTLKKNFIKLYLM